jgi:hypothetical protein
VPFCVGLIPQPRSPTKCLWIKKSIKEGQGLIRTVEASGKKKYFKEKGTKKILKIRKNFNEIKLSSVNKHWFLRHFIYTYIHSE